MCTALYRVLSNFDDGIFLYNLFNKKLDKIQKAVIDTRFT